MKLDQPQFVFSMRNLHVTDISQHDDYMTATLAPGVTIVHDASDNTVFIDINDKKYALDDTRNDLVEIGHILINNESADGDKRVFTKAVPLLQQYIRDNNLPMVKR